MKLKQSLHKPDCSSDFDIELLMPVVPVNAPLSVPLGVMLGVASNPVEIGMLGMQFADEVLREPAARLWETALS